MTKNKKDSMLYLKLTAKRKSGSVREIFLQYYKRYSKPELLDIYSRFDVNDPVSLMIRSEMYDRIDPLHRLTLEIKFYFLDENIKAETIKATPKNRRGELKNKFNLEAYKINNNLYNSGTSLLSKCNGGLLSVKLKHSINRRYHYFIYDNTAAVIFFVSYKSSEEYTVKEIDNIKSKMETSIRAFNKDNTLLIDDNTWINESTDFDEEFARMLTESALF